MHTRLRSTLAATAVLIGLAVGTVVTAGAAAAAPASAPSATKSCTVPQNKDDSLHIVGCLTDNREKPPAPVPNVKVSVEDESGSSIGKDTSDETGIFDITIPGSSVDVLGKSYTIKIDTTSLPKGTSLVDKKKTALKVKITTDTDIFVTFPIGKKAAAGAGKVTQTLQLFIGGITFSLLLAMAALGLSLIFGTTGLTNFAHGELMAFGAIVALGVDRLPGTIHIGGVNITVIVAIIAAFLVSGLFGYVQDRVLWAPLRRRGTGLVAMMIITIGLSILLRNVYQYVIGGGNYEYSQYASPTPFRVGSILITPTAIWVSALALIVLVLVGLGLQKTRTGKATRAVADNPALASASGINVERVIRIVWIGGAALAGLSGVLLGLTQGFNYQFGFKLLLLVFAAVVLGGLGTIWGALAGSFIIGTLVEVSTILVPAELKYVSALFILIVVLVFRPEGLLGRRERVG
jgi:branched-subunit amino acid ABC-type transport system permease component